MRHTQHLEASSPLSTARYGWFQRLLRLFAVAAPLTLGTACVDEGAPEDDNAADTETMEMLPATPEELLLGRWTSDISESPVCNDGTFLTTYEFSPADPNDPVQNGGQVRLTVDEDYTRDDGTPCSCIHTFTGVYQHEDDSILNFVFRDQDVRFCDGSTITPDTDDLLVLDDTVEFAMSRRGKMTVDESRLLVASRSYDRAP